MANDIVISGYKKDILWKISEMEFLPDTVYVFKGGVQGQKWSWNALAYCWVLMDKIAKHPSIKSSKEEIYISMLEKYGFFMYLPVLQKNVQTIKDLFRIVKDRGYVEMTTKSGKQVICKQLQCYKGLSQYDSKEMAYFIDMVVSDAKELGIETATPDELEELKAKWGNDKEDSVQSQANP